MKVLLEQIANDINKKELTKLLFELICKIVKVIIDKNMSNILTKYTNNKIYLIHLAIQNLTS